jgi:hypothetical protein
MCEAKEAEPGVCTCSKARVEEDDRFHKNKTVRLQARKMELQRGLGGK